MARLEKELRANVESLRAWIDAQLASIEEAMSRMAAGQGL
jgi:hypothetical protein